MDEMVPSFVDSIDRLGKAPAMKRKRAPRRNFGKEIADTEAYCLAAVEILTPVENDYDKGQVDFAKKVLAKINPPVGGRNGF